MRLQFHPKVVSDFVMAVCFSRLPFSNASAIGFELQRVRQEQSISEALDYRPCSNGVEKLPDSTYFITPSYRTELMGCGAPVSDIHPRRVRADQKRLAVQRKLDSGRIVETTEEWELRMCFVVVAVMKTLRMLEFGHLRLPHPGKAPH